VEFGGEFGKLNKAVVVRLGLEYVTVYTVAYKRAILCPLTVQEIPWAFFC
jgi:hypothetical protein